MSFNAKIILVVGIFLIFFIIIQARQSFVRTVSQDGWQTYENIEYGYLLRHPAEMSPVADAPGVLASVGDLHIGSWFISTWRAYTFEVDDPASLEINRLSTLDSKSFSEVIHEYQVAARTENDARRSVGKLREITFAGETAYTFTLADGFSSPFVEYSLRGVHTYILFERGGTKYLLHYPTGDNVASKISKSFEFASGE